MHHMKLPELSEEKIYHLKKVGWLKKPKMVRKMANRPRKMLERTQSD